MTNSTLVRRILSSAAAATLGTALVVGSPAQVAASPALVQAQSISTDAAEAMNLHLLPAMHAAGSVLGHPYRWGGAAPGGFDCSGLVVWSFGHAGRSLPRSSAAQRSATLPVSREDARSGDLVFYGSPVHHVGIYLGEGLMVHSPSSGGVVRFESVDRMGSAPSFGRVK